MGMATDLIITTKFDFINSFLYSTIRVNPQFIVTFETTAKWQNVGYTYRLYHPNIQLSIIMFINLEKKIGQWGLEHIWHLGAHKMNFVD